MAVDCNIGFVSFRLAGTDGVSLEVEKWVQILENLGHRCFFFAGESDWPEERSYLVPHAHFKHPEIVDLNIDLFDDYIRSPDTSRKIHELRLQIKEHLYKFIYKFGIRLIITDNVLSLPMNIPFALALTELIAETCIPTIGHHHDFYWERSRFAVTGADDYLRAAFPPTLSSVWHVVINSYAARQLALRTGVSSMVIPNVMDFENPPDGLGEYSADLKEKLGIREDEYMILQPTRVVPRKRIENAIELTRRLGRECTMVISHHSGDEGTAYETYLKRYAELLGVRALFAGEHFALHRGVDAKGGKIYSLADAYQQADLVTYPSTVEGFGNAFLETIYYCRPIVMSTYDIFKTDIKPKGFQVIGFEDFITDDTVEKARQVLTDQELVAEMIAINYELGKRHFSFNILEQNLATLLSACSSD